jgi:hypothetical protein
VNVLVEDFHRAVDPAALAGSVGVKLHRWQKRLIRSTDRRIALVAPRGAGKTLALSILGLHTALYRPQSVSLVLSASENQARWCFDYAARAYRRLSEPVAADAFNKRSLELSNGSRFFVVAASAHTARGYHADTLLLDEAAFIDEAVIEAILPSIAVTEGRIVLSSTPNGKRGTFASIFLGSDPAWSRWKITPEESGISPEAIAEFARLKGDDLARQEFGGEFLDSDRQAFATDDIDRALARKVTPWKL